MTSEVFNSVDFAEVSADPLAAALDGQRLNGQGRVWTARVNGVYRDERSCWVQVQDGDVGACVVVHCSRFASPSHVLAALSHWSPVRSMTMTVLSAMSVTGGRPVDATPAA